MEISFPKITKFVIIRNDSGSTGDLRVGFSSLGVQGDTNENYAILSGSESLSADYRVKSVFLLSHTATEQTASVVAGLTMIPTRIFGNWTGSSGVG